MGYIPPKRPTTTDLIRADLEPLLRTLFVPYERVWQEHAEHKMDRWFMFLNYALLASVIALVVAILWWLL